MGGEDGVIRIFLITNLILSVASLAWGYAHAGLDVWGRWILIAGAGWLFGLWRRWTWISALGLIASLLSAGLGLVFGLAAAWMFAGAIFGLVAWDLTDFRRRLALAYFEDDLAGMERRHLLRVSLLTMAALILTSIPSIARLQLTFEWMLLLALAAALALTSFVRWLRRSNQ